ncbi:MAG: phage terminase large subunit [Sneathiella sp.]
MTEIRPQKGPQERFLASSADIAIYGGAAGGGKSYALLLEPIRHLALEDFRAVIFRRTLKQVRNEGGIWDASRRIYGNLDATAKETALMWRFRSGATISFGAMEHEKNRYDWQGTEIAYLGFDELTHFTEAQFFYLLSRNRSLSGIKPYVRATCNPDADSWVADLVRWWIDWNTGLAMPERSGKIRWFVRDEAEFVWADCPARLKDEYPDQSPKSLTFVAASVEDNKILMEIDRSYKANLAALDQVERRRLLLGDWKIRPAAGAYFRRGWFPMASSVSAKSRSVRGWDLAATAEQENRQGDWTVGVKMSCNEDGVYVIEHVERFRGSPRDVEKTIVNLASQDGNNVQIALPQDPGQAGKAQAQSLIRQLSGYRVKASPVSGDKKTRAQPFSAQVEAQNVALVKGDWNEAFLNELEAFPTGHHDDQVDAAVEAFNALQDVRQITQQEMY